MLHGTIVVLCAPLVVETPVLCALFRVTHDCRDFRFCPRFPFGIYTGTVELELQVRLVSEREETLRSDTGDDAAHVRDEKEEVLVSECKRTLCPDICNATTLVRGDEEGRDRDETEEHRVGRLVKVKKDMSRCRSLGFLRKMPTIEVRVRPTSLPSSASISFARTKLRTYW